MKLQKIKFFSLITILSAVSFFCFGEQYRINSLTFYSSGITQSAALQRTVSVDKKHVFNSTEELQKYIADVTQEVINIRQLDNVIPNYTCQDAVDGIIPVDITFTVSDSKHLIVFPKFSYDSNTGAELKLKLKDSNFLGLLNTFNFDFNGQISQTDEKDTPDYIFGINCSYDYPFEIGMTKDTWSNDFSLDWTWGSSKPEFNYNTGLSFSVPIDIHSINFSFNHAFIRNDDYEAYNDAMYSSEIASISLPLTIGMIGNVTKVTYTPSINFTYNWDFDGIEEKDTDLSSPIFNISQSLGTSKINWNGNFRNGYSLSGSQSFGWNMQTEKLIPSITADIYLYKSLKYIGFNSEIYAFTVLNSTNAIGSKIRGVRDNQYFVDGSAYALKVDSAVVINFDMPIHIITTHWLSWGYALFGAYEDLPKPMRILCWIPHKVFAIADFELQLSPFIDIALTHNSYVNTTFSLRDGFYAGGLEMLIYPSKWKSYVIRTSVGVDLGRKLFSKYIDTSWRDTSISTYEIYFGLGLHY